MNQALSPDAQEFVTAIVALVVALLPFAVIGAVRVLCCIYDLGGRLLCHIVGALRGTEGGEQ